MNDRELLEMAAKAYGIEGLDYRQGSDAFYYDDVEVGRDQWCPQDNCRQSLGMAAKFRMEIDHNHPADQVLWVSVRAQGERFCAVEEFDQEDQRLSATCLAITRAAAEIGKAM
ncbi:hypothetical protein [Bowmanella yangjiangensis]|uniref:Phage ABA sandwich domain-containing protein n=1 Tax=Bowmanella yangjiangensis TaxID=2811230 RepID=A0ABS3D0W7_9ALTE|nr:hypothetical protein [Bowmanella yangjiangensis]MBN7822434.1 hypothetical protein [Bowmanella yangjiangensis]